METWKTVEEFPNYEVSDCGGFRRLDGDGYKDLMISDSGCFRYKMVSIALGHGRVAKKYLHRLVGQAFVPNPDPVHYDTVGFKNKDGHDCRPENLYWTNQTELMALRQAQNKYAKGSQHHMSKMTEADVGRARNLYDSGQKTITQIARMFGMDPSTMDSILKHNTWKHVK